MASGGELSRIMLALKTVLGKSDPVTTMVFDEMIRVSAEGLHGLSENGSVGCESESNLSALPIWRRLPAGLTTIFVLRRGAMTG